MTGERVEGNDAAAIVRIEALFADVPDLGRSIAVVIDSKLNAGVGGDRKSSEIRRPRTHLATKRTSARRPADSGIKPAWSDLAYHNAVTDLCGELRDDDRPASETRFRIPDGTMEFEIGLPAPRQTGDRRRAELDRQFQTRLNRFPGNFTSSAGQSAGGAAPDLEKWLLIRCPKSMSPLPRNGLRTRTNVRRTSRTRLRTSTTASRIARSHYTRIMHS